jgi:RNA polymerase sigma factor (sigma-70 family)
MNTSNPEIAIKRAAINNKRHGLSLVADQYHAEMTRRARFIMRDEAEAYDIVQEVFIRAMSEPRLFEPEFRIRAWLYRVTTNLCFNTVRNRKRRGVLLETIQIPTSIAPNQIEKLLAEEQTTTVTIALRTLNAIHQEVLVLRFYMDLSYVEIAQRLEICVGTVMSRLSRAKIKLNEALTTSIAA